jgi:hypothetical protein
MDRYIYLGEEVFEEIFQLIPGPDGDASWQDHEIHEAGIPDGRCWTIIEGDDSGLYVVPGWHYINKFGMAVSTVSWDPSDKNRIEGVYMEVDRACEVCGNRDDEMCSRCEDLCISCCDSIDHRGVCGVSFMAGAFCILVAGHAGSHRSDE